ncbi:MAG: DNA-binding transcriptional regulator [Planctomycetia bacterium]|nr:DNA-binding transcriptional regulator [Planctomycetia bacterium]
MKKKKRRIVVIMETTRAYAREVIRGIARFNREHGGWLVEFSPRGAEDQPPEWLRGSGADGIFARIHNEQFLSTILESGIPTLDLRRTLQHPEIPQIGPDDTAVMRELFTHFRELGFHSFAFLGMKADKHTSMSLRRRAFGELVRRAKFQYTSLVVSETALFSRKHAAKRAIATQKIREWLQKLPPRTAVIGSNDDMAFRILEECRFLGISIPDTLAVAGIGNDECFCDLGDPPLTSVDLNPQRIGYEAAMLMEQMMRGKTIPHSTLIAPAGVVPRLSSDTIAMDDEFMASALKYIRDHACDEIGIRDVLDQVHLSRVSLEKRFKKFLGRTIYQEILRIRLEKVRKLLVTTQLSHKQIAREAGFRYQEYMMRVFRQATGMTLKKYRDSNKSF